MIAVAVCTCGRPAELARLLAAIDAQRLALIPAGAVRILVVDNSRDGSAGTVCRAYAAAGRFALSVFHEPRRGLSHARNRVLREAAALTVARLALVDDDEMPAPTWLEELCARMQATGAAACVGPVVPVFARPPPRWASDGAFAKRLTPRDGWVGDAYTANALLDLGTVAAAGLAFDPRFNEVGGEDTLFFRALLRAGHRIAWAEGAVVYDAIPVHRLRRSWLLARWYRSGGIEAHLGPLPADCLGGRARNVARGAARLLGGGLRLAVAGASFGRWGTVLGGAFTLCRGAGLVAAAFGVVYREYSPSRYR